MEPFTDTRGFTQNIYRTSHRFLQFSSFCTNNLAGNSLNSQISFYTTSWCSVSTLTKEIYPLFRNPKTIFFLVGGTPKPEIFRALGANNSIVFFLGYSKKKLPNNFYYVPISLLNIDFFKSRIIYS